MDITLNETKQEVPAAEHRKTKYRFLSAIAGTSAGYAVAFAVNLLVPQIAPVNFQKYQAGIGQIDANQAYRGFLIAMILWYVLQGVAAHAEAEWYIRKTAFRFAIGIGLAIWDILGTKLQILPQPFFPGPAGIAEAFISDGTFIFENMLYSLRLFGLGFSLGVLLGVSTGILIGWFPKAYYWIAPVLKITGVIPAVAWMPFALTLFPTPLSAAVFLIVICAWFPVASLTASGIQSTPRAQFDAARTLGGNSFYLAFHVAIPHAMPQIFTGISTANAFAFTTLVMAEMMGQPGGLGYYINTSKVWSAYYKVFAAILVMAVLFSLIMWLIEKIQRKVLIWQEGLVKEDGNG